MLSRRYERRPKPELAISVLPLRLPPETVGEFLVGLAEMMAEAMLAGDKEENAGHEEGACTGLSR